MSLHSAEVAGSIHISHNYVYANAAARAAATGFTSADIGKVCKQTDTSAWYVLTATTPTWSLLNGVEAGSIVETSFVNRLGAVSVLTDGATPALDASLGRYFTLTAAGNRTIAVPTNPTSRQIIVIEHTASGGARTLAFNSGAGGFTLSGLTITATASGKMDRFLFQYNSTSGFWEMLAQQVGV